MANFKIILGENGQGKTRFLLKEAQNNYDKVNIIVISNSLINPFPSTMPASYYDYRYHVYNRTSTMLGPNDPAARIKGLIYKLISESAFNEIFYLLGFLGFDPEFAIDTRSRYRPTYRQIKNSVDGNYFLERIPDEKSSSQYLDINVSEAFLQRFQKVFSGEDSIFLFDLDNFHYEKERYIQRRVDIAEVYKVLSTKNTGATALFTNEIVFSKAGKRFVLDDASSGELYILGLGLFIANSLDNIKKHMKDRRSLFLIDEPENSLHPKWQRDFISLLNVFIGYQDADVYIATHSPFIALGADYVDASIYEMSGGIPHLKEVKTETSNIEQIYLDLFDVLTPKNKFLSELCNKLLRDYAEGYHDYEYTAEQIDSLIMKSTDDKQKNFLYDITDLLKHIREKKGNYNA